MEVSLHWDGWLSARGALIEDGGTGYRESGSRGRKGLHEHSPGRHRLLLGTVKTVPSKRFTPHRGDTSGQTSNRSSVFPISFPMSFASMSPMENNKRWTAAGIWGHSLLHFPAPTRSPCR